MTTKSTLKPCPFCASEKPNGGIYSGCDGSESRYSIWCWSIECGASVIQDTEEQAIEAWNKREGLSQ